MITIELIIKIVISYFLQDQSILSFRCLNKLPFFFRLSRLLIISPAVKSTRPSLCSHYMGLTVVLHLSCLYWPLLAGTCSPLTAWHVLTDWQENADKSRTQSSVWSEYDWTRLHPGDNGNLLRCGKHLKFRATKSRRSDLGEKKGCFLTVFFWSCGAGMWWAFGIGCMWVYLCCGRCGRCIWWKIRTQMGFVSNDS